MIPTGYFDFDAKIVVKKESAAKFDQLNEALNFVQKHKIKLDDSCYIGLFG